MTIEKAKQKYGEFHLKEPDTIIKLRSKIPRYVFPVGFCSQLSYNSNKWNNEGKWNAYIHYWENPTLVCISEDMVEEVGDLEFENGFYSDQRFDLGPGRKEITFLGYAIDFAVTGDDRSKIRVNPSTMFIGNPNQNEVERLEGAATFEFDDNPNGSTDYVACSPNGKVIYVVSDQNKRVFCFINSKCRVTTHGIEG